MKILYVTNSINGSGGLERVLATKLNYLVEEYQYEVDVIVLNDGHIKPFFEFNKKINFHSVMTNGNPFVYFLKYKKGIQNIINMVNPDIISVCDDGLKGLLFLLFFKLNQPIIYERHASLNLFFINKKTSFISKIKAFILKKIAKYGAKKFDKFIVLTNNNIGEWNLKNIEVIPNSLTFFPQKKAELKNKIVISVGSHSYNKGFDRLISIWKKVIKKHSDWKLEIYGKSNSRFNLKKMIREKKLEGSIKLFDPVNNIEEKYLNASIFSMSSRSEGFGMVLIEAMACGLPSVAFDCSGGPKDIIKNNEDGFLVEDGNLDKFTDKLIFLIENEKERRKMGQMARENVKRYNIDEIMNIWNTLFIQLLEKEKNK